MSTEVKITADNLLNISTKLDALDLSVEEKGLLSAVFRAAGCQLHGEVSGFNLDSVIGLGNSFNAVFHRGSDGTTEVVDAAGTRTAAGVTPWGSGFITSIPGVGDAKFIIS